MLRIVTSCLLLSGLLLALGVVPMACSSIECGKGTIERVDPATQKAECVPADNAGATPIPCNLDGGARLIGGVCEGDPTQYPSCGAGTTLDVKSGTCVPMGGGNPTPPPCSKPSGNNVCINGVVRYLKDGAYTKGKVLSIRAYDPFAFLGNTMVKPLATGTTDANGTYILPSVEVPGLGTIAVAVTDVGGPTDFPLSASGAQNLAAGGINQVDLFAVESSTLKAWDQQLGFSGADTFEEHGAYLGIFVSGAATDSPFVPGVTMTFGGVEASDQFFFKGDRLTIDKTAKTTDAATGSSVQRVSGGLGTYSGSGGGIAKWESGPGTSVKGVVFVQVFHPGM